MEKIHGNAEMTAESAGSRSLSANFVAPRPAPPAVLSIAGFDPSSGAGFTADLKVFAAHGLYGLACPTGLTVQSTEGVRRSEAVSAELVRETLECLAADIRIAGVKIGMLASATVVREVARWLVRYREQAPELPVVLDPVLGSSAGRPLLDPEAVELLLRELLPLATVATPNLAEAAQLAGCAVGSREAAPAAARALLGRMGPESAVIVTGGHFGAEQTPDDFLLEPGDAPGSEPEGVWVPGTWVHTRSTHGTGCAFSSALLCALVQNSSRNSSWERDRKHALEASVRQAKDYVQAALGAAYPVGRGHGPMHHLYALDAAPLATPGEQVCAREATPHREPSE